MKRLKQLKKTTLNNLITYALIVGGYLFFTVLVQTGNASRHIQSLLVPVCVNIVMAVSLNLVIGFLGELSLGHAAFMSVGAYSGSLFAIYFKEILPEIVRFPLAILVGAAVGAVFGAVVGIPVLRLKGDYLAIVTLAFGEILRSIIINLEFTGGASGLKGTPQDASFTVGFVLVMITVFVITNLANSKHGRAIMALRDNAIAAQSVGINPNKYKLMVFVIAAAFAGAAGALYSHNYSVLNASTFDYNKSIEILVMVVLGRIGSIRGSIIAAVIIAVLPEMLRSVADYRMLIYAVVLIAMMLLGSSEKVAMLTYKLSPSRLMKKYIKMKKEEV